MKSIFDLYGAKNVDNNDEYNKHSNPIERDEKHLIKIRKLYGERYTVNRFQTKIPNLVKRIISMTNKRENLYEGKEKMKNLDKKISFRERLIISPDAQWKSIFDIIVLVLVGFSCISNMLIFAYPITFSEFLKTFLIMMEFIFGLDLVLNFFMGFRHPDEDSYVTDYR